MNYLASWLADPARRDLLNAWSFLLGASGTLLTLIGLWLTYWQAKNARLSANQVRAEVEAFEFRRRQYDAYADVGEAKTALESAGKLIRLDSWQEAAANYDEARKAIIRVRLNCIDLPGDLLKRLKVIVDHLGAFSNGVDHALVNKGAMPDKSKVLIAIRRHSETLIIAQDEIQRNGR